MPVVSNLNLSRNIDFVKLPLMKFSDFEDIESYLCYIFFALANCYRCENCVGFININASRVLTTSFLMSNM